MKTNLIQTTSWGCTDVLFREDGTAVVGLDDGVYRLRAGKIERIYKITATETDYRLIRSNNFRYHGLTASKENLYFGYTEWTWAGGEAGGKIERMVANLVCLDKDRAVLWHKKWSGFSMRNVCADDAGALLLHLAAEDHGELLLYGPDGDLIRRTARKSLYTDDIWPFSYRNTFLFTEWRPRSRRLMQLCYHGKSARVTELIQREESHGSIDGRPYFPGPYFVSNDPSRVFQTLLDDKEGFTLLTVSQDGREGGLWLSGTQQIKWPRNSFWSAVPSRDGNWLYVQAETHAMPDENADIDLPVSSFAATVREYLKYCSFSNALLRIECSTGRIESLVTFPEEYGSAGERPFVTEDSICGLVWYVSGKGYLLNLVYPDGTVIERKTGTYIDAWSHGRTLIVAEHKGKGVMFRVCAL